MNRTARFPLILAFVHFIAACATAGNSPVGTWTGRIVVDISKITTKPDPQTMARIRQGAQQAKKIVISMTFKSNKTFAENFTGGQAPSKAQTGTWSQSGNTVTLTGSEKRPDGKLHSQVFTMAKNGKTLSLSSTGPIGIVSEIIFSR